MKLYLAEASKTAERRNKTIKKMKLFRLSNLIMEWNAVPDIESCSREKLKSI